MGKARTRSGWQIVRGGGNAAAYFICVLDDRHGVHLVGAVPCATRCGLVVTSRDRFRLTLRVTVYDEEACPRCWSDYRAQVGAVP